MSGGTIVANAGLDTTNGVYAQNSGLGNSTARLTGGFISTNARNSNGLLVLNSNRASNATATAEMTGGSVMTTGSQSDGLFVRIGSETGTATAIARLSGGAITTTGETSAGLFTFANNNNLGTTVITEMRGGAITTSGRRGNGLYAWNSGGNAIARLVDGAITTGGNNGTGSDAIGVYARMTRTDSAGMATVEMSGGSIITRGSTGYGLYASNRGLGAATVTMTGGSITTSGVRGRGIQAAIFNAASTARVAVNMSGGAIMASGADAHGISIVHTGTGVYDLDISGADITSGTRAAAGVRIFAGRGSGSIDIASDVMINSTASGTAIRDDDIDTDRDSTDDTGSNAVVTTAGTLQGDVILGLGTDRLTINGGSITGNIDLGGDDDTLTFNDAMVMGNILGGAGDDTFILNDVANLTGMLSGGAGDDALMAADTGVQFTLTGMNEGQMADSAGTALIANGFTGIENLTGGAGDDVFTIRAELTGDVVGGDGDDSFIFEDLGSVTGTLAGGTGDDTLNFMALSDVERLSVMMTDAVTGTGVASFINGGGAAGFTGIETFDGFLMRFTGDANRHARWTLASAGNSYQALTAPASDPNAETVGAVINLTASVNTLVGGDLSDTFDIATAFDGTLQGGAGDNTFTFADGGSIAGAASGGAGTDHLDYSSRTAPISVTLTASDATGFAGGPVVATRTQTTLTGGFTGIDRLTGGTGTDSLTGHNAAATWTLGAAGNSYAVGNQSLVFSSFENLAGGSMADSFTLSIDHTGNLDAGAGDDVFNLADGGEVGEIAGGAGTDHLDYSRRTDAATLNVTLARRDAGGFSGTAPATDGFSGINQLTGRQGDSRLIGMDVSAIWTLDTAGNSYTGTGGQTQDPLRFSGFATLIGRSNADTFTINGDYTGDIIGGDGADAFIFGNDGRITGNLTGGDGDDRLQGDDDDNRFTLSARNEGTLDGKIGGRFFGIENLTGGSGADTFTFEDSGEISGTLEGGMGTDHLDYARRTDAISATLTGSDAMGFAGGAVMASLAAGQTPITGGFTGIDRLSGGAGTDSLTGHNTDATWTLGTAGNNYAVGNQSLVFSNFENLTGGNMADSFTLSADHTGNIDTGVGNDSITLAGSARITGDINLGEGDDSLSFASADVRFMGLADGGAGTDTLNGLDLFTRAMPTTLFRYTNFEIVNGEAELLANLPVIRMQETETTAAMRTLISYVDRPSGGRMPEPDSMGGGQPPAPVPAMPDMGTGTDTDSTDRMGAGIDTDMDGDGMDMGGMDGGDMAGMGTDTDTDSTDRMGAGTDTDMGGDGMDMGGMDGGDMAGMGTDTDTDSTDRMGAGIDTDMGGDGTDMGGGDMAGMGTDTDSTDRMGAGTDTDMGTDTDTPTPPTAPVTPTRETQMAERIAALSRDYGGEVTPLNAADDGPQDVNAYLFVDPTGPAAQTASVEALSTRINQILNQRLSGGLRGGRHAARPVSSGMNQSNNQITQRLSGGLAGGRHALRPLPQAAGATGGGDGPLLWGEVFAAERRRGQDGLTLSHVHDYQGLVFGAEQVDPSGQQRLGVLFGYADADIRTDLRSLELDTGSLFGGVYGRFSRQALAINLGLNLGYESHDNRRYIPQLQQVAEADYHSVFVNPWLSLSRAWPLREGLELRPALMLNYSVARYDGYEERGGQGFALAVAGRTAHNLSTRLQLAGVRTEPDTGHELGLRLGVEGRLAGGGHFEGRLGGSSFDYSDAEDRSAQAVFIGLDGRHALSEALTLQLDVEYSHHIGGVSERSLGGFVRLEYAY